MGKLQFQDKMPANGTKYITMYRLSCQKNYVRGVYLLVNNVGSRIYVCFFKTPLVFLSKCSKISCNNYRVQI